MTQDVLDGIVELVSKSLPALQVDALREALTELESLRRENEDLAKELERMEERRNECSDSYSEASSEVNRLKPLLATAEEAIVIHKQKADSAELAIAQAKYAVQTEVVDKFLRVPTIRKEIQHSISEPYYNPMGQPQGTNRSQVIDTETTEEQ